MMKYRALFVEDDVRLASAVVGYLEHHNILCDHCLDGEKAINLIRHNSYEVLIADINMPHMSGVDMCAHLRHMGFDTPLIMVTSRASLDDKVKGFEAGADDYLIKPFELKELMLRVSALSKRKSTQANSVRIEALGLEIDYGLHKIKRNGVDIYLPKSSWALMQALVQSWPQPVSKKDLEYALWGDDLPDSDGLKVHIHHLRQRIDHPFAGSIIHAVRGVGFVLSSDHD